MFTWVLETNCIRGSWLYSCRLYPPNVCEGSPADIVVSVPDSPTCSWKECIFLTFMLNIWYSEDSYTPRLCTYTGQMNQRSSSTSDTLKFNSFRWAWTQILFFIGSFKLLGLWLLVTTNFRFWLNCNVLNSWAQWRPWWRVRVPAHCTSYRLFRPHNGYHGCRNQAIGVVFPLRIMKVQI